MTTGNMLRFLTNKLKTSSLNEANTQDRDDDKDSGTESDDENNDLDEETHSPDCLDSMNGNIQPTNKDFAFQNETFKAESREEKPRTHEISDHNFDTISCTSDYSRHSLDFDGHSSEDELESITEESAPGKAELPFHLEGCPSSSSTDEEVKDLLFNPQPVLLRTSPPKGVLKIYTENETAQNMLIRVVTPILNTVTPRKRHRPYPTSSDPQSDSEGETVIQRPCLDFEKMQQVRRLCPSYFKRSRMSKNVKLQTV